MFEEILSENAISVVESLVPRLEGFYLAGGTGLALQLGHRQSDNCGFFRQRFREFDINAYHVLKSLTFFEDAEKEPSPVMLVSGKEWEWETIKAFFIEHVDLFEQELTERK